MIRHIILIAALLAATGVHAGTDVKYPPGVISSLKVYHVKVDAAKTAYDKVADGARDTLLKSLHREMSALVKSGSMDQAMAVRELIRSLEAGTLSQLPAQAPISPAPSFPSSKAQPAEKGADDLSFLDVLARTDDASKGIGGGLAKDIVPMGGGAWKVERGDLTFAGGGLEVVGKESGAKATIDIPKPPFQLSTDFCGKSSDKLFWVGETQILFRVSRESPEILVFSPGDAGGTSRIRVDSFDFTNTIPEGSSIPLQKVVMTFDAATVQIIVNGKAVGKASGDFSHGVLGIGVKGVGQSLRLFKLEFLTR